MTLGVGGQNAGSTTLKVPQVPHKAFIEISFSSVSDKIFFVVRTRTFCRLRDDLLKKQHSHKKTFFFTFIFNCWYTIKYAISTHIKINNFFKLKIKKIKIYKTKQLLVVVSHLKPLTNLTMAKRLKNILARRNRL